MSVTETTVVTSGATNGWDAICALDAAQVTSLFFQQYLKDGPTNPVRTLDVLIPSGNGDTLWALSLTLGPPSISFAGNLALQQCQVSMFLIGGSIVQFDPDSMLIQSVLYVQPNTSSLSGPVNLAQVTGGVNTSGQVYADLGSGAYRPSIAGIDADSVLATEIGSAVQTFFQNAMTRYSIGTVLEQTGLDAALTPTSFEIVTQPANDGANGGCVLLLITTNGSAGALGQLQTYPIPSGSTAALLVSNRALFASVVPAQLTTAFQSIKTKFTGTQNSSGQWYAKGSGGTLNIGVLQAAGGFTFTSNQYGDEDPVILSADGTTASADGTGDIVLDWSQTWAQPWVYSPDVGPEAGVPDHQTTELSGTFSLSLSPAVAADDNIISFTAGTPTASVVQTTPRRLVPAKRGW